MHSPHSQGLDLAQMSPPEDLNVHVDTVGHVDVDDTVGPQSEDVNARIGNAEDPDCEVQASQEALREIIPLSDSESDGDGHDGSTHRQQEVPRDLPVHNRPRSASPVLREVQVESCDEANLYNAAGKAPLVDVVMPKGEGEWWTLREQRKKKKAEEKLAAQQALNKLREEVEDYRRLQAQGVLVGNSSVAPPSSNVALGSTEVPSMEEVDAILPGTEVVHPVLSESQLVVPAPSLDVDGVPPVAQDGAPDVVANLDLVEDSLKFSFEHDHDQHSGGERAIGSECVPTKESLAPPDVGPEEDVYDIEMRIPIPAEGVHGTTSPTKVITLTHTC